MSAHAYSEERIVEQPAIALFAEFGWRTASAMEEIFHPKDLYQMKCAVLFEHVYESYRGEGASVYSQQTAGGSP